MNIQSCSRCGYGVYPAEKINCIDQTWHKTCFHCEVCKMILTVNNFVSHQKKPYCHVHNPKNNNFTSVYETPLNIKLKKQSDAVSEVNCQEDDEQFKSIFHWDMKSKDMEAARTVQQLASQKDYWTSYGEGNSWSSGTASDPEMIRMAQAQKALTESDYADDFEHQRGKGSFPAMITPAYQRAKKANQLASQVEYKRGHDERVSRFTTVTDTPELLHARAGGQLLSDVRYSEEYEQQRGKGSFPAMITPAYQIAKRANELASDVKYHQQYHKDMKGKGSHAVGNDAASDHFGQEYLEEFEEHRGKGSFPAMITPAYQNAKKANELASDIKYRQDLAKMKGAAHYHSLSAQDNLVLKRAQSVNKLVSEVEYKKDLENSKGHSINYCETPQFRNMSKISKYTSDNKYKENYQNQMKGHYEGVGMDRRTLHAMKVGSLASNIAYKANYNRDSVDYNYPATITPTYQTTMRLVPLKESNYRQSIDKLKYSSVTSTPQIVQAKINAEQLSHVNYRAEYEKNKLNYTLPQDVPQLVKAKANAALFSEVKYKEGWEKTKGRGFEMNLDAMSLLAAKASGDLASNIKYKEEYEKTKGKVLSNKDSKLLHSLQVAKISSEVEYKKGFEESKTHFHLPMDMVNIKHAQKAQALASDFDYRKKLHKYTVLPEDMKTKWAKKVYGLQSELQYKTDLTWMKGVGWMTEGSFNIEQAKKAGELVSEKKYRQRADALKFTSVTDSSQMEHAKKSQELQSDVSYRAGNEQTLHQYTINKDEPLFLQARANAANLSEKLYKSNWEKQKEKGFELRLDSLPFLTAKAKRDLASDKKYRQHPYALKFTSIKDTPEMIQARISYNQAVDRLYKEHGEDIKHHYTQITDLPEVLLAKLNAMNISEIRYKESWTKLKDDGYILKLDAIPFQAAKASSEIISDFKYKEAFEKMKGQMLGSQGLENDINLKHSVQASALQSGVNYKKDFESSKTLFHLPLDMVTLVQAKKAQNLISDQEYKQLLHHYTPLSEDLRLHCAKKAHKLQSENLYRSDLNFMRGVGCIIPGALEIEGRKKASDLISESKYRQQPQSFKYTAVTDSPGLLHAKFCNQITNERLYKAAGEESKHQYTMQLGFPEFARARMNAAYLSDAKYKESWHNLRAQGYKLTMEAIPFQTAKASGDIASDYQYRHDFVKERGKLIGPGSLIGDCRMRHCLHVGQLQSQQRYAEQSQRGRVHFHLPLDMVTLVQARKAQGLASERDYRTRYHEFTVLPEDLKMYWAKKAHALQSESRYKSDLNFMKGLGWLALRSPQIENVKKAGELISEAKYRQKPDSIKFTTVVDSPDMVHAKNSYIQCNDRLYRSGDAESRHRYTLLPDHPDFLRARLNALHLSDKMYKTSWEQTRAAGYDFRLDAIPFQTAKASREIASDFRYKEAFLRDRGQQSRFLSVNEDPKMRHFINVGKLQSDNVYKREFAKNNSQFKSRADQPGFVQAKKSQQLISDVNYRQHLHNYTCDPEQLNMRHARKAHNLQSDVKYKSDLNWIRGIGWTPPGSYRVEMARRAAELANTQGLRLHRPSKMPECSRDQQENVNPDATEILQVRRKKTQML
ncbi:nebulin-related-anchoring protein isoform X3 [Ornithorhynchus anatinus]|uniref:Nebulin related anchoring protein n=1 Tax=Ornithorhynchus anatinus TaxID=9258 RepID=A0A6I8PL78_ORNAN|nr:nebulin-related-anchoring protein isoform X3 [Ornithorhynchus anatinus]